MVFWLLEYTDPGLGMMLAVGLANNSGRSANGDTCG
jgi:hypothetical protein